jgi:tetratricopeptide (TPR) repeat protein
VGLGVVTAAVFWLGKVASHPAQPAQPQAFAKLNFRMRPPPAPWVALDAKKLAKDASVAFMRADTETYVTVIAEVGPRATTDLALELWRARLTSRDPDARFGAPTPVTIAGLSGRSQTADATLGAAAEISYVNTAVAGHGYIYQLMAWCPRANKAGLQASLDAVVAGFEVLDVNAVAQATVHPAVPFQSPEFGYAVSLPSTWTADAAEAQRFPSAEYIATCGSTATLLVMPFPLFGEKVPASLLEGVLARRLSVDLSDANLTRVPVRRGRFEGVEVRGRSKGVRATLDAHLLLLHDDRVALVAAQLQDPSPDPDAPCADALDRITFGEPSAQAARDGARAARASVLFTDLAERGLAAGQVPLARALAEHALALDPTGLAARARVDVAAREGKKKTALPALDAALKDAPENAPARAVRAELLADLGQTDAALRAYQAVFAAGLEDDGFLRGYVQLLEKLERAPDALAAIERYRQHRDSPTAVALAAGIERRQGKAADALALLEAYRKDHRDDLSTTEELIALHREQSQWQEVQGLSESAIADGATDADLYFAKGESELALKWFPRAKATLEKGLALHPGDPGLQRLLDDANAVLGHGNTVGVKAPIEAVALPQALGAPAKPLPDSGRHAIYALRARAIAFEPGKDLRITDYERARVLDATGVQMFSTFEFDVDPLRESIYVNEVAVLDAQGQVVARGSPDEQYLSDRANEAEGTQRRVLYVPVTGLHIGQTVSVTVTRRRNTPDALDLQSFALESGLPTERSALFVRGTVAALQHRSRGVEARPLEGGLLWSLDGAPARRAEPFGPNLEEQVAEVWLTDARSTWEGELREYLDSLREVAATAPEVAALAQKLVAGAASDRDKIRELDRYVQREISYRAIEFGRGARVPRPAATTLQRRYGDCKDEALLLHQLLEAAGVANALALARPRGAVRRDVPSLDQFDHMIVVVPGSTPTFLDPTQKSADPLLTPTSLMGTDLLLVQPGPPVFLTPPALPLPDEPEIEVSRKVTLSASGDARVHEAVVLRALMAAWLRDSLGQVDPAERAEKLAEWLSSGGAPLTVENLRVDDLERTDRPLRIQLDYVDPHRFQAVGSQLVGGLRAPWERMRMTVDPVADRETPFEVRFPFTVVSDVQVEVPRGHQAGELRPASGAGPFSTWKVTAERQGPGPHLTLRYSRRPLGRQDRAQYAAFGEDARQALEAIEPTLALPARTATP